jgi:hypothetical protein
MLMGLPIELHWLTSPGVSCLYAARALLRKRSLADPALADALADPAADLQTALEQDYIPAEALWSHLIPLAVGGSLYEAAETALVKTMGRAEAEPRVSLLRAVLAGLLHAFSTALPGLEKALAPQAERLQQEWNHHGAGLLGGLQKLTEHELLVSEATVVMVHPALAGGGEAFLPYNLACIEAVPNDPVAELPEALRLAWLLSMLNLDLPRYSDELPPERLPILAGLAMIPPTLASGENQELIACDEPTVALAIKSWLSGPDASGNGAAVVKEWWSVYCNLRTPWPAALQALNRMLKDSDLGSHTSDEPSAGISLD